MRTLLLIIILGLFVISPSALPQADRSSTNDEHRGRCRRIERRREWRDIPSRQRVKYLQAVKCLHSLPPRDATRAATSRFEEFQLTHILLTNRIHFVGHFLPWHRHLLTLYSSALREECGYDGPTPYWDWTRDASSGRPLLQSPIFHPVAGFGGDGVEGTYTLPLDPNGEAELGPFTPEQLLRIWKGCVRDGPFADSTFHLGPGRMTTSHCLVRGIDEPLLHQWLSTQIVQDALATQSYEEFRQLIDINFYGIHGGGHGLIGGEMTNGFSAPGDPIFYLHHANLDRVWWQWQRQNPSANLYDISGPTTQGGSTQVTLEFELDFPALGRNVTIREVMNISQQPSCYTY